MRNLIVAAVAGSIFLMSSIGASVVAGSSPCAGALLVAAGDGNHMTEGRAAADKQPAWPGCDFGPGFDPVAPANTKSA